jgi:hypothetical protein
MAGAPWKVSSPHTWPAVPSLNDSAIQVTGTVTARAGGKSAGMTTAMEPAAGWCLGCGTRVTVEEAFCPTCGTRQVPDRPMPVDGLGEDSERLARSTNAWLLAAIVIGTVLLLVAAILAGWFGAAVSEDDDADRIGRGAAASVEDPAGDAACCLRPAVAG